MKPAKGIIAASVLAVLIATILMAIVSPVVSSPQFTGVVFTYTLVGSLFAILCVLLFGWPLSIVYKNWVCSNGGNIVLVVYFALCHFGRRGSIHSTQVTGKHTVLEMASTFLVWVYWVVIFTGG